MATPIRPVIAPEPFTGEGSWDDWIDHFESVAAVNKWEDAQKLLWIRVRMTGRAQRAYTKPFGGGERQLRAVQEGSA